jgi:hypothetical protein
LVFPSPEEGTEAQDEALERKKQAGKTGPKKVEAHGA